MRSVNFLITAKHKQLLAVFPLLIGLLYSQNSLGIERYQSAVSTAWETAPTYLNSRYNFYEFNHDALAKDTEQKDDGKGGFTVGLKFGLPVLTTTNIIGSGYKDDTIWGVIVNSPYYFHLGHYNIGVGVEASTFALNYQDWLGDDWILWRGEAILGTVNTLIYNTPSGKLSIQIGGWWVSGYYLGFTSGASFDYTVPNMPLLIRGYLSWRHTTTKIGANTTPSLGWIDLGIAVSFGRPSSRSSKSKRVSGGGEYLTVIDIISPELKKNLDIATKTLSETLGEQHPITIKVSSMLDSIEAKVRITDNGGIVEYSKIGNPSYDDFFITAARLDGMAIIGKSMITHSIKQLKYFAMSKASDEALQLNIKLLVGDTPPEEWSDEQAISVLRMANEKRKVTSDEKKYFLTTAGLIGIAVLSLGEAIDEAKELIPKGKQLMKNTKSLKYAQIPKATKGIKNSIENLNSVVNNAPKMLEEMKVLLDALKSLS